MLFPDMVPNLYRNPVLYPAELRGHTQAVYTESRRSGQEGGATVGRSSVSGGPDVLPVRPAWRSGVGTGVGLVRLSVCMPVRVPATG